EFRASTWVRRFATSCASDVIDRYSYACDCNNRINSRSSSASDWYEPAPAASGMYSATTVLSDETAIGSYFRGVRSLIPLPPICTSSETPETRSRRLPCTLLPPPKYRYHRIGHRYII